jgi:hypothetical protein
MIQCNKCGFDNLLETQVCSNCGNVFEDAEPETSESIKANRPLVNKDVGGAFVVCFIIGIVYGMIIYQRLSSVSSVYFEMALFMGIGWMFLSFLIGAVIRWFGVSWHRSILGAGIGLFISQFLDVFFK